MTEIQDLIRSRARELRFSYGSVSWDLIHIGPGQFVMGSPAAEEGREEGEVPPMPVSITRPFYLGRHQVTQAQWQAVMPPPLSAIKGAALAVDQIRYREALEFCARLSNAFGVTVTLPTEAQWEYACRAGTTTRFYTGNSETDLSRIAWYGGNSGDRVHEVGQKEPNAWGLFDMLGNLYEPCIDYIMSFDELSHTDPEGRRFPTHGAMRGGAWTEPPERCRAAARLRTSDRFGPMGIRLVINA